MTDDMELLAMVCSLEWSIAKNGLMLEWTIFRDVWRYFPQCPLYSLLYKLNIYMPQLFHLFLSSLYCIMVSFRCL